MAVLKAVTEKGEKMPPKETHKIKMMYAVYADGRKEPIVIDEIKDLSLEEAEPILEEHDFVKVTRCKDCKYLHRSVCPYGIKRTPRGNDYCSYGERREDER